MTIYNVTIKHTIQRVSPDAPHYQPGREWEILDSDNMRLAFAPTEQDAFDTLHGVYFDTLGSDDFEIEKGE